MSKLSVLVFFLTCCANLFAQQVNYSPAFFGPNANPVAEFTDATIPKYTNVSLSGNYFFGFGDKTVNPELKIEIPLVSERVSLKLWVALWEYYAVNQAVYDERQMAGNLNGTTNGGDIYVQTRISVLKETKIIPAVILNSTLKTASGEQFAERRYFNTPGYYFDTEIAKSILFKTNIINDLRFVINTGFLCWETTESVQNDSFLYGGKIILSNRAVDFENALAGYTSRIGNGDNPLVYSAKLTVKFHNFHLFAQYKYGIRDWHYNQLQAGVSVDLQRITPRY